MNMSEYFRTWRGTRAENRAARPIMLVQALTILALVMFMWRMERTVVTVPPTLTQEASISQNKADGRMQETWAMYFVTLTGNMTPRTAPVVKEVLQELLSPRAFNTVSEWIDSEIAIITRDRVTLGFSPDVVRYEPHIDKVVVTGDIVLRGQRGNERRQTRTYELGFSTSNYRVQLTDFNVYEGRYSRTAERGEE